MPRPKDLAIEALSGAVAAVTVAVIADRAHAARRRLRSREDPAPDGEPHDWTSKVAEFVALHLAFRGLMHATRFAAQRIA